MRTARVPMFYPCRYVREKLSVRESDRRCSPLVFCRRLISVGGAHHYRKHMNSIRRFRTKLTFQRNTLHFVFCDNWLLVEAVSFSSTRFLESTSGIETCFSYIVRRMLIFLFTHDIRQGYTLLQTFHGFE